MRYSRADFDSRALGGVVDYRKITIDLSTARDDERLPIQGSFLYLDKESSGLVYIKHNAARNAAMPMGANMGIYDVPFEEVYVANAAQAGASINLWYGFDARISPANQDIANIGTVGTVGAITPPALVSGAWGYRSTTVPVTLVAAAANISGIVVHNAELVAYEALSRIVYHVSPPTAHIDLVVEPLLMAYGASPGQVGTSRMEAPRIVPPGNGIYAVGSSSTHNYYYSINYEML